MRIVCSDAHLDHQPPEIINRGVARPHVEIAERAAVLLEAARGGGHELMAPATYGAAPRAAIHDPGYLEFLETAWTRWQALPDAPPAVQPYAFPNRRMTGRPTGINGLAGYYMASNSAPIVAGTWKAACASTDIAVHAAELVLSGERAAYALCRPPGHHAFQDLAGGFCYMNNVAVAAQHMRRRLGRVAILDVDVHHGNGTQGIFYGRSDVLFVSIHGDPSDLFPFFSGYAHECGEGAGFGYTLNLPLPPRTLDDGVLDALETGLGAIGRYAPEALLVSLGFDAHENDPLGSLRVSNRGFGEIGRRIARLGLPTVLIQEGGYHCPSLGRSLSAFLAGFEEIAV